MEPLYEITVNCAQCGNAFRTSRVRPSFKKAIRVDSDFCKHYKLENENPDFYVVRVCPECGFASTESFAEQLHNRQRMKYQERLLPVWKGKDYGGKRTAEQAMEAYKLALLSAQTVEENERVIAGILHHIAWLYRYRQDWEGEQRFLRYALESYIRVYETGEDELNRARLMFLIGELHRRLKDYSEAIRWFGRVIQDKTIMDASTIRACRDGWARTREDMLAERMELPDELKGLEKRKE